MDLDCVLMFLLCCYQINYVQMERRNIALNKPIIATKTPPLGLEKMVDGDKARSNPCASTDHQDWPWISVDLGRYYLIDLVTIYGRTDRNPPHHNYYGIELFFVNRSDIQPNTGVYPRFEDDNINFVNVSLKQDINARYLTILLPGSKQFVICELEVFGSECKSGMYGPNCTNECGCYNNEPCDAVTGVCNGCDPGYTGPKCLSYCSPGTYGKNCSQLCGQCACENCNHTTGACSFCSPGYQGLECQQECEPGRYGVNCSLLCGACKNHEPCHNVIGICVNGCWAGRKGDLCRQTCETNTFGENCAQLCHCHGDGSCNQYNGACDNGACADGYTGSTCQQLLESDGHEVKDDKPDIVLIGVVAVLGCIIVALLAVVAYILRKWKSDPRLQTAVSRRPVEHTYDDLNVYQNQL